MKPVAFAYERPRTVDEASRLLAENPGAKAIAGGQTLGPMLNLRLAQPDLLVDIARIPDLARVEDQRDAIVLGALVTHAAIEDGRVPDCTNGFLPGVARGIAYRAIRTRGTIGGSLAHADPAADWLACFTALDAEVLIASATGRRSVRVEDFVRGAMDSDLAAGELVEAVRIPKLSSGGRSGFHKLCRKTGEFADAIGAVVHDPGRHARLVSGATGGRPIVIDDLPMNELEIAAVESRLRRGGLGDDPYGLRIHAVALKRALEQANDGH